MAYDGSSVTVSVHGEDGAPNVDLAVPADPGGAGTEPIGQAGLWRFTERCRGVAGENANNSADGDVGLRVVQCLEGVSTRNLLPELVDYRVYDILLVQTDLYLGSERCPVYCFGGGCPGVGRVMAITNGSLIELVTASASRQILLPW